MTIEVEQKFRVADEAELQRRLAEVAGRLAESITQRDAYFAHPARDFAQTDETLRIRSIGEENFITYKGPRQAAAVKTRREIELPLGSGGEVARQFAEMLQLLGFTSVATVRKRRRQYEVAWQGRTLAVALDEVEKLGSFCEVEICVQDSDVAAAQQAVSALAGRLALTRHESRSYLEMVLENPKVEFPEPRAPSPEAPP